MNFRPLIGVAGIAATSVALADNQPPTNRNGAWATP